MQKKLNSEGIRVMKYRHLIIFGLMLNMFLPTNIFAEELSDEEVLNQVKAQFAQAGINDAKVLFEEEEKILFMELPFPKSSLHGMDSDTISKWYVLLAGASAISAFKIATKGKNFRQVKIRYDLKDKEGFCPIAIAKLSNFRLYSDKKITLADFCRLLDGNKDRCK